MIVMKTMMANITEERKRGDEDRMREREKKTLNAKANI